MARGRGSRGFAIGSSPALVPLEEFRLAGSAQDNPSVQQLDISGLNFVSTYSFHLVAEHTNEPNPQVSLF